MRNNDVDGSHRQMNTLARCCHLPLYQMPQQLFDEGQFVHMQPRLLLEGKLQRQRRQQYRDINRKLDTLSGTTINEGKRCTTSSLLHVRSRLQHP